MRIVYKGQPNTRMDKLLEDILRCFQYEFIGSGYSLETDERDLQFEKMERVKMNGMPTRMFTREYSIRGTHNNKKLAKQLNKIHEEIKTGQSPND